MRWVCEWDGAGCFASELEVTMGGMSGSVDGVSIALPIWLHGILLISMLVCVHPYLPTCLPTYLLVSSSVCLPFAYLSTCIRFYPPSC